MCLAGLEVLKQVQDALQSLLHVQSRSPGSRPFQPYTPVQPCHMVLPYPDALGMALPQNLCPLMGPTLPQWSLLGTPDAYPRLGPAHPWDTAAAQIQCLLGGLLPSPSQAHEPMLLHAASYPQRQPPAMQTSMGGWPGHSLMRDGHPAVQQVQQQPCNSPQPQAWPSGSNEVGELTARVLCAAVHRVLQSAQARAAALREGRVASPRQLSGRLLLLLLLSRNRLSELIAALSKCVLYLF